MNTRSRQAYKLKPLNPTISKKHPKKRQCWREANAEKEVESEFSEF